MGKLSSDSSLSTELHANTNGILVAQFVECKLIERLETYVSGLTHVIDASLSW